MKLSNSYLRFLIAKAAHKAGGGHIPSCYSCIDLVATIFELFDIGINPNYDFVLSKGHAALSLYTCLASKNLIGIDELNSINTLDSRLGGHPDASKVPSVIFNTGSLGHGLPCSIGYALSKKESKKKVFCMLGDGECNEGTTWESAALAKHLKVGNLTVIIDYNKSTNNVLPFYDLAGIWKGFGWEVHEINGHNNEEIKQALNYSQKNLDNPTVIVANTIKGYGIDFMENNGSWHYKCPTDEELELIKIQLEI